MQAFVVVKNLCYILSMKVSSVSSVITPKTTGYASAVGMGLTLMSGMSQNKIFKKAHKPLAIFSAIAAIIHIGLIEYYNYKFKR